MVRVAIPYHLQNLAKATAEFDLEVPSPVTTRSILDALEAKHPVLRGTIRDYGTLKRRPLIRFYCCSEDWSLTDPDEPLPESVASGEEPFLIIGAIAGGS